MKGERVWVKELRPGTTIQSTFAVRSKELRQRRNGGAYLAMTLADRTGQVAALAWENVEEFHRGCSVGDVVRVEGQVQRYNQRLQLVIRRLAVVPGEEVDESLFVRSSATDPHVLWRHLEELVEAVTNPHLKQLLYRILADPEVSERLRFAPAARSMHHAYRSGLLEHTVSVARVARMLAEHYGVDTSLVLAGAILHDLGKVWELQPGPSIEYTDSGRLLGHLAMEVLYVEERIRELPEFPRELRRHLLHILLSHHGEYAYGSPRRPKTPEAMLVHMVDNLDARLTGMLHAIEEGGETGEAWTAYSPILERYVYRRRPDEGDG